VPGSVKNAVDYLYNDWIGKPIVVVSYGIKGGMSANESLNTTLVGMKLRVAKTRPSLTFRGEGMTEVFLAGGQGVLGPESKKDWEGGESRASILKAFEELVELLEAPAAEEAKTE
jgi:NAD(P)H-dependent FMN reductase